MKFEKITKLRRLFLEWLALRPDDEKKPCCQGYHFTTREYWDPLPDSVVCDREKAWRAYVRVRDGNQDYPFRRRD